MPSPRYLETFMIEALKQFTERGRPVADVARSLAVSCHSLYAWIKRYGKPSSHKDNSDQSLHCKPKFAGTKPSCGKSPRREILNDAAEYFVCESRKGTHSYKYRLDRNGVVTLYRSLEVHRSGFLCQEKAAEVGTSAGGSTADG